MKVDIRHSPSFAVGRITLDVGEEIKAEAGAMVATSGGVEVSSDTGGGLLKGLKRSFLGGESLFITTYKAPTGGWVDVAHHLAGDIVVEEVSAERPLSITRGCWLASAKTVELDTKWGGFKNLFGGEGGFLVQAMGAGPVVLASYGAIDRIELQAGETITVDSGHVVAFDPTTTSALRKVTTGIMQTLTSGEGLVFDFTGPGWVMTQSRNPSALEAWIRSLIPPQTSS